MKNSKRLIYTAFCAFMLLSFTIVKQNNSIELILSNLNSYTSSNSPSKIYVQTDRPTYALEDTIWFKAYTLDASTHFSTNEGKVIYIDLYNSNGDKVLDKKLYAENLGTASDFVIDREWEPGRYKLRAYTNFMLNQDLEYIYNKEIQIVDINKASDKLSIDSNPASASASDDPRTSPNPPSSLEMKFFPESGDLVAGIVSRVAIKIENYSSELGDLNGSIEDKSGNVIAPFKVYEKGYGLASFTPKAGTKYFAKLDNLPELYPLPKVKDIGYNITTVSKSDETSIIVATNKESGLSEGDILVHSKGRLIYHKKLDTTDKESFGIKLNTKEMPTGVTHVTFFDKEGIPRSERLFFVDNNLSASFISTNKSTYSQREKVDLSLSVINSDQKSFDCSVSVFNKSSLNGARPFDNIKSWMLLNSDLRGEISDPTFYFQESGDRKKSTLLDLVLMTHGWRRFTWEDMSQENAFKDLEHEREVGLFIKGYTKRLFSNNTIKSDLTLSFLNSSTFQQELVSEDDGSFAFGPFIIEDSLVAVIQARRFDSKEEEFEDANKKLEIEIDDPKYPNLQKPIFEEINDSNYTALENFINSNKNSQALKNQYRDMEVRLSEVVFTAKAKTREDEIDDIVSERSIYATPSNRLVVEDRDRSIHTSVLGMLREIPGIVVGGTFPNEKAIIRGNRSVNGSPEPLYLLDGLPVDLSIVNRLSTDNILFIDVLKGANATAYGLRGGNGVIAIYTGPSTNKSAQKQEPGIVNLNVKGFDTNRQFYSPDYSKNVSSVYEPDVRSTLYWNPDILLTKGEENSMSFFTGDNIGNFVITTEGLSEDGEPIFSTHEFSVQEN